MRRLLSFFGSFCLIASISTFTVSCNKKNEEEKKEKEKNVSTITVPNILRNMAEEKYADEEHLKLELSKKFNKDIIFKDIEPIKNVSRNYKSKETNSYNKYQNRSYQEIKFKVTFGLELNCKLNKNDKLDFVQEFKFLSKPFIRFEEADRNNDSINQFLNEEKTYQIVVENANKRDVLSLDSPESKNYKVEIDPTADISKYNIKIKVINHLKESVSIKLKYANAEKEFNLTSKKVEYINLKDETLGIGNKLKEIENNNNSIYKDTSEIKEKIIKEFKENNYVGVKKENIDFHNFYPKSPKPKKYSSENKDDNKKLKCEITFFGKENEETKYIIIENSDKQVINVKVRPDPIISTNIEKDVITNLVKNPKDVENFERNYKKVPIDKKYEELTFIFGVDLLFERKFSVSSHDCRICNVLKCEPLTLKDESNPRKYYKVVIKILKQEEAKAKLRYQIDGNAILEEVDNINTIKLYIFDIVEKQKIDTSIIEKAIKSSLSDGWFKEMEGNKEGAEGVKYKFKKVISNLAADEKDQNTNNLLIKNDQNNVNKKLNIELKTELKEELVSADEAIEHEGCYYKKYKFTGTLSIKNEKDFYIFDNDKEEYKIEFYAFVMDDTEIIVKDKYEFYQSYQETINVNIKNPKEENELIVVPIENGDKIDGSIKTEKRSNSSSKWSIKFKLKFVGDSNNDKIKLKLSYGNNNKDIIITSKSIEKTDRIELKTQLSHFNGEFDDNASKFNSIDQYKEKLLEEIKKSELPDDLKLLARIDSFELILHSRQKPYLDWKFYELIKFDLKITLKKGFYFEINENETNEQKKRTIVIENLKITLSST